MKKKQQIQAYVDTNGNIVLPKEITERLGFAPGSSFPITQLKEGVQLRRPVTQLAKVYIEPTTRCNLSCRTCVRNTWDEAQGDMSQTTFKKIMAGLRKLKQKPAVFFGGLGGFPVLIQFRHGAIAHVATGGKHAAFDFAKTPVETVG